MIFQKVIFGDASCFFAIEQECNSIFRNEKHSSNKTAKNTFQKNEQLVFKKKTFSKKMESIPERNDQERVPSLKKRFSP